LNQNKFAQNLIFSQIVQKVSNRSKVDFGHKKRPDRSLKKHLYQVSIWNLSLAQRRKIPFSPRKNGLTRLYQTIDFNMARITHFDTIRTLSAILRTPS
jgi:hypothetical protein